MPRKASSASHGASRQASRRDSARPAMAVRSRAGDRTWRPGDDRVAEPSPPGAITLQLGCAWRSCADWRALALFVVWQLLGPFQAAAQSTLLNASYDPTRRFYAAVNKAFTARWRAERGESVRVYQSHGGSGAQARAVIYGLEADVVTLALASDIDAIASRTDLLPKDWQRRLPHNSAPYTSTIVLRGAQGQPERHSRLARPDQAGRADRHAESQDERRGALELSRRLGLRAQAQRRGRGTRPAISSPRSTETRRCSIPARADRRSPSSGAASAMCLSPGRTRRLVAANEIAKGELEVVVPSLSMLAEPPVAIVDKVVDRRGTRALAQAYLEFLYTPEGQTLAAEHYLRPSRPRSPRAMPTGSRSSSC